MLLTVSQACDCGDASCELDFFGPHRYSSCDPEDDRCREGSCLGGICTFECDDDTHCPGDSISGHALCLSGLCRPASCFGPVSGIGLACVDGALHRCVDLAEPPCGQCGLTCGEGEICLPWTDEPCLPLAAIGGECIYAEQCLEGTCGLVGDAYECHHVLGTPCTASSDRCECLGGFCTASCSIAAGDGGTACPPGGVCSAGIFPPQPDGAGYCFPAFCGDGLFPSCAPGQQCIPTPEPDDDPAPSICVWPWSPPASDGGVGADGG